MKKGALLVVVLVIFMLPLAAGPDLWAAPGQSAERQTVPTRTSVPQPTKPSPTEPPPTAPPSPPQSSSGDSEPAPAGPSLAQLEGALTAAWDSADWQRVIDIIHQMLTMDPNYDGLVDKLYTAHVNYGHQFLDGGDTEGAVAQFNRALELKPGGEKAMDGLQQASGTKAPVPSPAASSAASDEAVVAGRPSQSLLPGAGGRSVRFHLGAAMVLAGLLVLAVIRRR
jgi:hypothetical protein